MGGRFIGDAKKSDKRREEEADKRHGNDKWTS